MKQAKLTLAILMLICAWLEAASAQNAMDSQFSKKPWMLGPFVKPPPADAIILGPNFSSQFLDPLSKTEVRWEGRAIIGGAAIVRDNKVQMIYQGEDLSGGFLLRGRGSPGVQRLGLATSDDGMHFNAHNQPVVFPDNDDQKERESRGGCEIPRLVEVADGTYYLFYDGWNHHIARLQEASSKDLVTWTKLGAPFLHSQGGKYANTWSKSASIMTQLQGGKLIAAKINGKYWMYWGEGIYVANSDDMVNWTMVEEDGHPKQVAKARADHFDDGYLEGGLALLTEKGIVIIYNSFTDKSPKPWSGLGEILMDKNDPTKVIDRCDESILIPDREYELQGSVDNVVFATGLVFFRNQWFLYHNGGDRVMCVAVAQPRS